MSELLPCPFCGGDGEAVFEIDGTVTVECVRCGALADGIDAWNTRVMSACLGGGVSNVVADAFDKSMAFCQYVKSPGCLQNEVERLWFDAFEAVLVMEGFNSRAVSCMWENLVQGNWERLHLTDEERKIGADEWLAKWRGEVWYCSDRWSLDRLARCHWMYRNWKKECE